jgi:hypothetical protein
MARLRTSRLQQFWVVQFLGGAVLGGAALPALRLESAFSCGFSR